MRVAVTLAYNGKDYHGSQVQKDISPTIFGTFEKALLRLGIDQKVVASGRTDRGVHATGQVCSFDLPKYWQDREKLKRVLNFMLPSSIRVLSVKETDKTFHARYSTKRRVYRYIIKETPPTPFEADFVTYSQKKLDLEKIKKKMQLFCGKHDFQYFKKNGSDEKTTIRTIYKVLAYRYKGYTILTFEADGFLRSQVRMMVGSVLKLKEDAIIEKLHGKKNHKVNLAPPNGLYLAKIKY